jgi:YHS domain-containing protein
VQESCNEKDDAGRLEKSEIEAGVFMVKDVVCGMDVDEKKVTMKSEYKGKTYYFCSKTCKVAFEKEPEKYIKEGENK